jgi:hypothetical protein
VIVRPFLFVRRIDSQSVCVPLHAITKRGRNAFPSLMQKSLICIRLSTAHVEGFSNA